MKNEQNADDLSILNKQIEKNLAEVLEGYKKRDQQRLHRHFIVSRALDFFTVIVLICVIIIVIILFIKSFLQGFTALFIGFFIVRYLLKKRSVDLISKFFGWF